MDKKIIIEQYTSEKNRMHNVLKFFDKRFGAKVCFYGCLCPLWWLSDSPHNPKVVPSRWFYLFLISKIFLIKVFGWRVPLIGCHWWYKYMWIKSLPDQGIETACSVDVVPTVVQVHVDDKTSIWGKAYSNQFLDSHLARELIYTFFISENSYT